LICTRIFDAVKTADLNVSRAEKKSTANRVDQEGEILITIQRKSTGLCKTTRVFGVLLGTFLFFLSGTGILHGEGYTWKPLRIGAGGWLTGMDIAPDGTKVVRADTYGAYVWSGSEWKQLVTALSMPFEDVGMDHNYGVYEIRIAPGNSNRLYMMYGGAVYRSDNRGDTWIKTTFTPVTGCDANDDYRYHGQKMAVDPNNPNVVYVGTTNDGLWMTTDGGSDWIKVTGVPDATTDRGGMTGIAFDPSSGQTSGRTNTIYVGSWGIGVYRSTNAGDSWMQTSNGPTTVHHGVVSSDAVYYATDGSAACTFANSSWTIMNSDKDWHTVAVDPAYPGRVVLGSGGGYLEQSLDGGTKWDGVIYGTPAHPITRVADDIPWLAWTKETYLSSGDMIFDPTASNKLYFSEGIGVWYTTDCAHAQPWNIGVTWNSQNLGIEQLVANQIVVPPDGKPIVASWDRPVFYVDDPDMFPSRHGPDNQYSIVMGWDADYACDNPNYVAAIMNWGEEKSGYSTDGGRTWTPFATQPPFLANGKMGGCIAVSNEGNIVWSPENQGDPYYTKNGGVTWKKAVFPGAPASDGWGWAYYLNRHIVAADRVRQGKFYAYNYLAGLYSSSDGGDTWTLMRAGEIASFSGFNAKLRAVPGFEGHLFFTVGQQGNLRDPNPSDAPLMRSIDGGATWTAVPNVKEVYDFGFGKPARTGEYPTVFIAGWIDNFWGIWASSDNCVTWEQTADFPLGSLDMIKTVAGDPNIYGRVYVGFAGSGYAYGDLSSSGPVRRKITVPQKCILNQNFPNPFNPVTRISFSIPARNLVCLEVSDILGRTVASFINKTLEAGTYEVEFNGGICPSGIYYYTLKADLFTQTRKCLLLK
jgi:hypothetical protein